MKKDARPISYGVKMKKWLGQNFLKSHLAIKKIVEAGEINKNDTILEIGPGKGILTSELFKYAKVVIAVEKDRELFEFLKIKFEKEIKANTLILVCEDILNFNTSAYRLEPSAYKIIANIPYNITGAILKKFLAGKHQPPYAQGSGGAQPERMVLLVQHEVAQRIVARDSKESILSISVKAYGEPKLIMKVPARYFSPAPKVDSAIIEIRNISREFFIKNNIDEERFWKIVKMGFAHKRKVLKSNLKNLLSNEILSTLDNKRAENLKLFEWLALAK